MPAYGLWSQVVKVTTQKFVAAEKLMPTILYTLGCIAGTLSLPGYALQRNEFTYDFTANSAAVTA